MPLQIIVANLMAVAWMGNVQRKIMETLGFGGSTKTGAIHQLASLGSDNRDAIDKSFQKFTFSSIHIK